MTCFAHAVTRGSRLRGMNVALEVGGINARESFTACAMFSGRSFRLTGILLLWARSEFDKVIVSEVPLPGKHTFASSRQRCSGLRAIRA